MTITVDGGNKAQIDAALRIFNPPTDNCYNAVIYETCSGWGDAFVVSKASQRGTRLRGHGFKHRKPEVGDILLNLFQSGGLKPVKIVKVEPRSNPHDMFFWEGLDFIQWGWALGVVLTRLLSALGINIKWCLDGAITPRFCISLMGGIKGNLTPTEKF